MERITESDYLLAMKIIQDYRLQISDEINNTMGGVNAIPKQNDIIRIIKTMYSAYHSVNDTFVVRKVSIYNNGKNNRIVITSTTGKVLRSTHYEWLIIGEKPKETVNRDSSKNTINFEDVDLYDLDLSVRSQNCLRAASINTLYKIIETGKDKLLRIRNMGRSSVNEISDMIYLKYNYLI